MWYSRHMPGLDRKIVLVNRRSGGLGGAMAEDDGINGIEAWFARLDALRRHGKRHLQKRLIAPDEVAALALLMASVKLGNRTRAR
jgi:hypothetical protein